MSDQQFHTYLEVYIPPNEEIVLPSVMSTKDLESMKIYLQGTYDQLTGRHLKEYVQFGENLILAQNRHHQLKKETKFQQTWKQWIEENTTISPSYARQIVEVTDLVRAYPKLKQLRIGYTEFYKMKKKIKEVFTRNEDIRTYWTKL